MYLSPDVFDPTSEFNYGFLDYFNFDHWPGKRPKYVRVHQDQPQAYDLVIFCSPAYSIHYTRCVCVCVGGGAACYALHQSGGCLTSVAGVTSVTSVTRVCAVQQLSGMGCCSSAWWV